MDKTTPIHVKLASRVRRIEGGTNLARQCPDNEPVWGNCRFNSHLLDEDYDWLVVIDDLSPLLPGRKEPLNCPPENTILLTSEPSSVTNYGKAFAAQFNYVITNQDARALPHPRALRTQTGNVWYYGKTYAELIKEKPPQKSALISTVCSSKQQKHTLHAQRYQFTQKLKKQLPELNLFGHGIRYVENKYDAIEPYCYHLVIENQIAKDLWSEKLADAFLGYSLPIYCGCPNILDYFPEDSLILFDIDAPEQSMERIREITQNTEEYDRRLNAVIEARKLVMDSYNLPSMLSNFIENANSENQTETKNYISGRKQIRIKNPMELGRHLKWNIKKSLRIQ